MSLSRFIVRTLLFILASMFYYGLYLILMRLTGSQVVNLKTSGDLLLSFSFDYFFLYHLKVIDPINGLT